MGKRTRDRWLVLGLPTDLAAAREIAQGMARYAQIHQNWQVIAFPEASAVIDPGEDVGGVALVDYRENPDTRMLLDLVKRRQLPHVSVGGHLKLPETVLIRSDDEAVGRLGAEHLLSCGLRSLAFYGDDQPHNPNHDRRIGFEQCIATHRGVERLDLVPTDHYVDLATPVSPDLLEWLNHCPRPIGFMAQTDQAALHLHLACRMAGLRIPEDAAIVSVHNDQLKCQLVHPAISSIELGLERLGYRAAQLIDRMADGQTIPPQVIAFPPVRVVARGSTDRQFVNDPAVLAALRHLRENLQDTQLSIDAVAEEGRIARRTLERRFTQAVGRPMHRELVRLRMVRAEQMIRETDEPIRRISTSCGYATLDKFYTAFKKAYGDPPALYRRNVRRGPILQGSPPTDAAADGAAPHENMEENHEP